MRGRAFVCLALRSIPRNHGWIAYPPYPLARIAAASSARLRTILTLERAHTRPYTAWRKRQAALRRRVASLISGRRRGTFPLGLPECIRQTPLPCDRGPHLRSAAMPRVLLVSCIMSWSFATAPKKMQPAKTNTVNTAVMLYLFRSGRAVYQFFVFPGSLAYYLKLRSSKSYGRRVQEVLL